MENERNNDVLYIINEICNLCKGVVRGRKKLMKVMFFVEHYDVNQKKLVSERLEGNNFIIYRFGPFSFDVMDSVNFLKKEGLIEENNYSITVTKEGTQKINKLLKNITFEKRKRIDSIIKIFGTKDGDYL